MILSVILVMLDFTITLKCLEEVLRCPTVVTEQVMAHSLSIDKSMRSSYKVWNQNLIFCWHQMEDRKSTRLNSSHLGISYAVFCLKKKKNTTGTPGANSENP